MNELLEKERGVATIVITVEKVEPTKKAKAGDLSVTKRGNAGWDVSNLSPMMSRFFSDISL